MEAKAEGSDYLVQRRETSVVAHFGFMPRLRLRVVLGPLCMLLSDEGFEVRSTI